MQRSTFNRHTLHLGVNETIRGRNTAVILSLTVPPLWDHTINTALLHRGMLYGLLCCPMTSALSKKAGVELKCSAMASATVGEDSRSCRPLAFCKLVLAFIKHMVACLYVIRLNNNVLSTWQRETTLNTHPCIDHQPGLHHPACVRSPSYQKSKNCILNCMGKE